MNDIDERLMSLGLFVSCYRIEKGVVKNLTGEEIPDDAFKFKIPRSSLFCVVYADIDKIYTVCPGTIIYFECDSRKINYASAVLTGGIFTGSKLVCEPYDNFFEIEKRAWKVAAWKNKELIESVVSKTKELKKQELRLDRMIAYCCTKSGLDCEYYEHITRRYRNLKEGKYEL